MIHKKLNAVVLLTFFVVLLVNAAPFPSKKQVEQLMKSKTLVVLDDNQINLDMTRAVLEKEGHAVICAVNGMEALKEALVGDFDIILMDCRMPVMDGPEAMRQLFDQYGREAIKVVAVTASVFEHQRQEYMEMGFDEFTYAGTNAPGLLKQETHIRRICTIGQE